MKDYLISDITLAEWGRKEISIAETEMPGLTACKELYGKEQPLIRQCRARFGYLIYNP